MSESSAYWVGSVGAVGLDGSYGMLGMSGFTSFGPLGWVIGSCVFLVCGGCLATVAMLLVSVMLAQMGILWMLGKSCPLGSIQDKCTDNDGNGVVLWYTYVTLWLLAMLVERVFGCLAIVAGILGFGRVWNSSNPTLGNFYWIRGGIVDCVTAGVELESAPVSKSWRAARLVSMLDSDNAKTKDKANICS